MNFFFISAGRTGLDCIRMLAPAIPITGVIGLAEGNTGDVAGFYNGEDIYKTLGIAYVEVTDYGLRSQDDRARLLDLPIDILFVVSWQRLIPQWLIEHCTHEAIGFHGSPWGIEGGRGRTPQNWALILGKSDFSLSMFAITPGVDSGNVLATREFAYMLFDDICSSQYKVTLLAAEMIRAYIAEAGWQKDGSPQDQGGVRYLPQRMPQDGAIDWRRSALEIYNFIRAQTRPFPGAFSKFGPNEMRIWRARPFALDRPAPSIPGQLAQIFTSGDILIGTGDGLLLVEDYSLSRPERLSEGLILESVDFSEQVKKIIRRHQSKHPNPPLQEALMPAEGFSDLKNLTPRGL